MAERLLFVGVDLAKNVFAVHGVNDAGRGELVRPAVPRARLRELVASLPPCTIGMQACTGAHHWAREATVALEDLPGWANTVVGDLLSEVTRLDERVAQYDRHIAQMARDDEQDAARAHHQGR